MIGGGKNLGERKYKHEHTGTFNVHVAACHGVLEAKCECESGCFVRISRREEVTLVLDSVELGRDGDEDHLQVCGDVALEVGDYLIELFLVEGAGSLDVADTLDYFFQLCV